MHKTNYSNLNFGNLILIGLSHKTAPVETRELLSLPATQLPAFYERLAESGVDESVYVSTCNRVEVYMTADDRESAVETIKKLMEFYTKLPHEQFKSSVYSCYGLDAVRHLLNVTSSLDSMVIGENEITGQVKESYRQAVECGATGILLNKLFHKAFATAKRVRTETGISKNPLSVASIAVEQAKKIFPDMTERRALLIGAGEMGELILKYLVKENLQKIVIANRTVEKAQRICAEIGFEAEIVPLVKVDRAVMETDIVISSVTAPHHVITAEDTRELMFERDCKPLFFIDIAVPRNIEPSVADIKNVFLYNVDSLKKIAEDNKRCREIEMEKAERIIDDDVDDFVSWCEESSLAPTIIAIKSKFEEIRTGEIAKFRNRKMKNFSEEDFQLVEELTLSIMNRTLHNPIINLKKNSISCRDGEPEDLLKNAKFLEDLFTK